MTTKYLNEEMLHACAKAAHNVNRDFNILLGEQAMPEFDFCTADYQQTMRTAVSFALLHADGPEASHDRWMASRIADGWTFGLKKDLEKKISPNLRPFKELDLVQQLKDAAFIGIVREVARLGGFTS